MKLVKFVAFVLGFVLVFQGVSPVQALVSVQSVAAEDYASARLQAGLTGQRILVVSELTEVSSTWVNPDGTLTTESYGSPVRVRDGSAKYGWRDLDFTLELTSRGVEARSGLLPLVLSSGGSSDLVSVEGSSGVSFGFRWDGVLPAPQLHLDTARYVDVLPGVDLLVRLDATGFEQFFEVKSKPSLETLGKLSLLVSGKSVSVVEGDSGFEFVSRGEVLADVVAPSVYDSAVTAEVEPLELSSEAGVLSLVVEPGFFDDPDLVYPVIVDPAVTLNPSFDTYVSSEDATVNFESDTDLWIGTPDAGATIFRSYLNFDSTPWQGQDVVSASLNLYLAWSGSCVGKNFSVYNTPPTASGTVWGNAPALTGNLVTRAAAGGYSSSCASGYVNTDVTSLVRAVAPTVSGTAGFGLRATNETDIAAQKRFNSANAFSQKPFLTVTYNRLPSAAQLPSVSPATTVSGVLTVGTAKPLLSSAAFDPDGNDVTLIFKTYASATSTTALATLCSVTVASGVEGSCRPTAGLTDGQTYFVRVTVSDGRLTANSLSPALSFKISATVPTAPVISCPYVNGYQGGAIPATSFSCNVSTPAVAVSLRPAKVSISLDGSAPVAYDANADGSFSKTVSIPAGAYQRKITASSESATGIESATISHTMSFGAVGVISPLTVSTVASNAVVSGYGATQSGLLPSSATIEWRKQDTTGSWSVAASNLPLTTRAGLKGVYNYKLNVSNLGVFGSNLLPQNVPVSLDLRFCFYYSSISEWFCSDDSELAVTRLPNSLDGAVSSAGPGIVSLVSGKFNMSTTDYSQQVGLQSLSVSRTFTGNAFYTDTQSSVFGEGWSASFSSTATALAGYSVSNDASNGRYYLVSHDFDVLEFASTSTSALIPVSDEAKAANLQVTVAGNVLTVVETDQATTTFTKPTSGDWRLLCARSNGSSRAVITTFDVTGRVSASGYAALGTVGCQGTSVTQGLVYSYNTSGLLATVSYRYLDTATGLPVTVLKKSYTYDSGNRLTLVTDNANGSTISYEYNGLGRLSKVSVSGFSPYTFKYDASGRLVQVARSLNSSWVTSTSVEQTFVYDLNPSGNTGLLPNLPLSTTSLWGQDTAPFYAAAVFGADSTISLDTSGNVILPAATSTLWRNADFTFLDVTGKPTNTASYGKTKWLYTATIRDKDDVVYASFDPQGVNNVLDRTAVEGNSNFDEFMYASVSKFYTQVNGVNVPNGAYVSDSWSPIRTISNAAGVESTVRTHTSFIYDEGQQTSVLTGLLTTSKVGLVLGTALSTSSQLLGKTVNEYAPQDGSTVSGWTLGTPTLVKAFDSSDVLISTAKTVFNLLGQPVKTVAPGSTGVDARTDVTVYYSEAANTLFPECGLKPAWQDLLCISQTGENIPSSKSFVSAYDPALNHLTVAEYRFGSLVRTTTNTYLVDGRADTSTVSASGAASISTKHLYDPVSLLETKTENYVAGVKQSETSQTFDAWGRQITSTNSLGEVTSTSYVPSGQLAAGAVSTVVSPRTTTTYTYGNTTEPRALVTAMTITGSSSAGTPFSYLYSGVYDEYGRLTNQSGPNGVTQTNMFNDAGQISSMSYGSISSTVLSWSRDYDGYGRVVRELAPDSASSAAPKVTVYGYDSSSRLATVSSNGASCFSESYSYNTRGDRTSSSVGVCGATTTKTNSFNAESQLTTSGYVYDTLDRNTFIPAVDAPANNVGISLSYNLIDQVTGITQSGSTTSFTYDALGRRVNETAGGLTTVRHYSDSTDNPEWTTQQSGANLTTEIYTGSLGAGLAVTTTFKGTVRTSSMQLTDIRGHTVTTLDLETNSVAGWSVYDSFGNPQTSQTNTNLINYSSYGQQERATNTTGLILMGARVYNPETNQFTSKDPIKGGNENSYTYPNEPINASDFSGLALLNQNHMTAIMLYLTLRSVVVGYLSCLGGLALCILGNVLVSAVNNLVYQGIDLLIGPKSKSNEKFSSVDFFIAVLSAAVAGKIGWFLNPIFKKAFGFWGSILLGALKFVIKQIVDYLIRGALYLVNFVFEAAAKNSSATGVRRERT